MIGGASGSTVRRRPMTSLGVAEPSKPPRLGRAQIAGVLIALIVVSSYKQPHWPATWIDEGFVTNGAKTLATQGLYGTMSGDAVRLIDPTLIANGPGVLLPVALAMRVAGVGMWSARGTAMLFMIVAGLMILHLASRLAGPGAGLASLAIVLAMPREGFVYLGRMAMGNVPALVYVCAGLTMWIGAVERTSLRRATVAGLLLGVAAVTKGQWSFVLPAAVVLAWAVHVGVLRRRDTTLFVALAIGVAAPLCAWYGVRLAIQGADAFAADFVELRETMQWNVLAFDPIRFAPTSLLYLARTGIAVVAVAGVGFAATLIARRHRDAPRVVLPAAIAVAWFAWYVIVSVGWPRYAFEGLAISAVLAGPALVQWPALSRALGSGGGARVARAAGAVLTFLVIALVLAHGVNRVRDLSAPVDRSAEAFAATLGRVVGPDDLIESWDWQLDVLTDRRLHHPDDAWVGRYTAQIYSEVPVRDSYEWRRWSPAYVIDGPFSKFTGIYRTDLANGCCTLVVSEGAYDLYRVVDLPARPR